MINILRNLFSEREDKSSLEYFLANLDSRNLIELEAKERIERGVVEIVHSNGKHCANGLLVGRGYFLTVKHSFTEGVSNKAIIDSNGNEFEVYPRVFCSKKTDLALARIKKPEETFEGYSFLSLDLLNQLIPSVLILRRNAKLDYKGCLPCHTEMRRSVISDKIWQQNILPMYCFSISNCESGDSGGVFATSKGQVMGFMKGSWPGEEKDFAYAVKADYIPLIIKAYLTKR